MMPIEVVYTLCGLLGTTEFDYLLNPTSTGALTILVYVGDITLLGSEYSNFHARNCISDFVRGSCHVWRLPCCEVLLKADWEYWRSCLRETDGPLRFSRLREEGRSTLLDDLTDQVIKRIGF